MTEYKSWTIPPAIIRLAAYSLATWQAQKYEGSLSSTEYEERADSILKYIYKDSAKKELSS